MGSYLQTVQIVISGYTMGGVIHVLLVIALIVVVVQLVQGRRRA